jgi:hypothetical protein
MNSEQSGDVSRCCYDQCYMAHALLGFEIRFAPVYGHTQLGAALLVSAMSVMAK